jgi:hypothetical protein
MIGDNEPLTEEWLKSVGFICKQGPHGPVFSRLGVALYFCHGSKTWKVDGVHWMAHSRGHVRRLCELFGNNIRDNES